MFRGFFQPAKYKIAGGKLEGGRMNGAIYEVFYLKNSDKFRLEVDGEMIIEADSDDEVFDKRDELEVT